MKQYQREAYAQQTASKRVLSLGPGYEKLIPIYRAKFGAVLPTMRSAKILDVPCGSGNASYFLRKMGYAEVDSIDLDQKQVQLAQALGLPATVADGLEWLTSHISYYDAILSLDFLEHLDKDSALHFLRLCYAALNPGGVLVLRTPCAEGPFAGTAVFNDFTHEWAATSGVLRDVLAIAGFSAVVISDDGPVPYNLVNWVRLVAFRTTCAVGRFWGNFTGLGCPTIWTPNMWAIAKKSTGPNLELSAHSPDA
jgi:2-polyprenyl-3-methyl-5-hydroxy-6-metoxy-1,4-benzoquinol methylase